ncbi:multidrug ABC transporter substrate-binding protein, partial [archaeon CG_4_10_14_0_2_um_filter_Archaea_38_6]
WKNIHIILMVTGEAIIISLIGGIAGVILGFLGSYLVQLLSGIPTIISPILIVEVLLFSSFIGLASAVYPAIIASRMSPVEAVTYE